VAVWGQQREEVNVLALRRGVAQVHEQLDLLAGAATPRIGEETKRRERAGLGIYHPGGPPEKRPDAKKRPNLEGIDEGWIRKQLETAKAGLDRMEKTQASVGTQPKERFDRAAFATALTRLRESVKAMAHPVGGASQTPPAAGKDGAPTRDKPD